MLQVAESLLSHNLVIGRCDLFIKAHQKPGNLDQKEYLTPKHSIDSIHKLGVGNVLLATAAGGRHGRSHAVPPLHEVQRGRHGDREAKVSALMAKESTVINFA